MDIGVWLRDLGLEEYAEVFAENGVDAALLPELTNEDFKDLGITRLADRKRLLKAITEMSEGDGQSEINLLQPIPSDGERRQVTVLFADLTGFTRLSSELGAEETQALLNRYFEAVDGIVESYGGAIDKHIGDNVMAVFGAPIAHDDDPVRAVRAALDIHERMVTLSKDVGYQLHVHIGIANGQVVASGTGSDAHREYTVTGDSVNLASRLQDQAVPGETLVSDALHHAVADVVDCKPLGEVEVKGLDVPMRTWRVAALRSAVEQTKRSDFVGRRAELRQFRGAVETCLETGQGEVVVVRGEAGMGKTRLVEEFTAIAGDMGYVCHKGLVLDFGVGKGQDAVRTVVRSLLGIAPGANKAIRQAAAEAALAGGLLGVNARVFLNDLLDLPQSLEDRSMYDAMDNETRNSGKRNVVTELIRNVSARGPILVVVEDVHWADPLLLTYLAAIAAGVADCAAVLVMTTRIEGDPLDQSWRGTTGDSPLMTIDLRPLRKDEAISLAKAFIDASDQFAMECIERAEGNPLFLEQLLRSAEERGEDAVPASIQSLTLSRTDRLPAADKQALQTASVIGQRFALDALQHLLDDDNYNCAGLVEHYLVRPEGNDYLFAHALIQEGVYSSLLKATRSDLHARAAEWFADYDPILRAQHLDRAESRDAPQAYLEAAQGQASLYHYEHALRLIERGLELAQGGDTKFELMKLMGNLHLDMGQGQRAVKVFQKALETTQDEVQTCHALIGLAAGMRLTDKLEEALSYLAQAEGPARANALDLELARLHHLRGNLYFPLGNIEGCREEHGKAFEHAQKARSPEWEAQALCGLGDAEYARGRFVTAHDFFGRSIELCRKHGFGRIESANTMMIGGGGTSDYMLNLAGAIEASLSSIQMAEKVGHDRTALIAHIGVAMTYQSKCDFTKAKRHTDQMKVLIERIGTRRFLARALQLESKNELAEGHREEATRKCRDAIAISRETGIGYCGPSILALLARATNDENERLKALSEGERLLKEGCVGHNYFEFYIDGMEGALERKDWALADRYASALEEYTRAEPLPKTDFFIARGRALAAHGRGDRNNATASVLRHLRDEATRIGLNSALPALDQALAAN
jgi:class 3 adenylate cyclase/tetratricopeptide (TPR) repeat protein